MKTPVRYSLPLICLAMLAAFWFEHSVVAADLAPGGTFAAGTNPIAVAVGDFNRDGRADLAVANQAEPGSVSILLGNGDATFQPPVSYAARFYPHAVAVADFNRDGKLDLAVANNFFDPGVVSILLGNGDGTFQPAVNYPAGPDGSALGVADFNRDGKLDLAVANGTDPGSVSILLGNGNGTFATPLTYGTGRVPLSIAVGDLNRNGTSDLILPSDTNPGFVYLLLGNANGTFQSSTNYRTGRNPDAVALADFNGDGKIDVATANAPTIAGSVSVMLGNGNGTLQPAASYVTGPSPASLATIDCNRDGWLDLAVADDNGLSLFLGNGDGSFGDATSYPAGSGPTGVAVGDFNRDRKPDLAVANFNDGTISLLLNTTPGIELGIVRTNNNVVVSWLYPSTGFVLESATTLSPPNWQPANANPIINDGFWEATIAIGSPPSARFFRLHQQ